MDDKDINIEQTEPLLEQEQPQIIPLIITTAYCRYQVEGEPEVLHIVLGLNGISYCMWEDAHESPVKMIPLTNAEVKARWGMELPEINKPEPIALMIGVFGAGIDATDEGGKLRVGLINWGNPLIAEFRKWFDAPAKKVHPDIYKEDLDFNEGDRRGKFIGCWVQEIAEKGQDEPYVILCYDTKEYEPGE